MAGPTSPRPGHGAPPQKRAEALPLTAWQQTRKGPNERKCPMGIHADAGKSARKAAQIPVRPPTRLGGLRELLGLSKQNRLDDLTPQVQMGIALAKTKREGETYAGTVSYAEKQHRRAAARQAKASRRNNRRSR